MREFVLSVLIRFKKGRKTILYSAFAVTLKAHSMLKLIYCYFIVTYNCYFIVTYNYKLL